ncbi:MAG TPA: hypothetical protein VNO14_12975 [Blastocatellia bacterium]|nr:hypothetical protein [Blastocatellia bacterium]
MRTELKAAPRADTLAPVVPAFELDRINEGVLGEFKKAWRVSKAGTAPTEGVVLLFRRSDGSYCGRSQGATNQYKAFTFTWPPNAIAIVHTHPNGSDPRPHSEDMRIADKYRVPILTITTKGMYMYDPGTKKTTKLLDGLDWLDYPAYQRVARR